MFMGESAAFPGACGYLAFRWCLMSMQAENSTFLLIPGFSHAVLL